MEQILRTDYVQELHEYHTLRRWLDVFPEAILGQYPRLCFRFAMLLLCSSDLKAPASPAPVERLLHLAERAFEAEDNRSGLGEGHASRALLARLQGDLALAARLARQALGWLPSGELQRPATCLRGVAERELPSGQVYLARQMFQKVQALV